ncbi:LuxR C-terminal-related transcriptional regulator [Cohnella sp. GbtcB17]|uniref:LuxR C-terminal-related transcriptional regulator n=1 Tax=Cohnella sp. GbtcB17 TaxID=2824762 RepID=UPI001C2F8557|nr:LuxR C-terminal-related transcriptional regulator [Cohnella sp. GbtcB17]
MNAQIITTKLYIPVSRSKTVPRPRLLERLNEGLDRKLTLVSASAGFGKTTLVAEWAAGCGHPVAWLSLDERDNDAASFLAHLVAAVNRMAESIGGDAAPPRISPPSSTDTALTVLLNETAAFPVPFVLVLDDFHVIRAKPIDDAVAFLLEHLPPQMHLVIATREDPQLPLSRLRVRGDLTELRAADLRFSAGEAAAFLSEAMGLALSADDIFALESRTEGWIAGLQLAALSMRGREDIPAFIRAFTGDNRYILDYLVDEVLRRQPAPIRNFLLQTSILERLSGPLCDAVTGEGESGARLEALEKGNFFVVPLDDRREWYRYHHLFGEVLAAHLKSDQPDRVPELHRRASLWYEIHGSAADAIRHALSAGDVARAADLIELAWPEMRRLRQGLAVLGWLKALPDELVRRRPVLSAEFAWALMAGGEFGAVEERFRDAERGLETAADIHASMADRVVVDQAEFERLPGTIAGYRAARAQVLGDIPAAIRYARQVLDLVPEGDRLRRGAAAALLGLAAWTSGDLETAYRLFDEGMAGVLLAGNISDAIGGAIALADIRIAQGRLRQAMKVYERGLALAEEHGERMSRGAIDIYVAKSELSRERNDLQAAAKLLLTGKELNERALRPQIGYRWHVAMARLAEANEDLNGALAFLQEAERLYRGHFFPNVRPVPAIKTRVWLAMGRLEDALDWVREQGLSAEDELSYLREFEHVTLARVLLAKYMHDRTDRSIRQVSVLLERLLQAAEEGGRTGSAIEILILQAMAHDAQGDRSAALGPLERALTFAEAEGYVRVFADEGSPMAALLEAALKQGVSPGYIRRLLSAFGSAENGATHKRQALSEPLSDRELEVLRLFRTELNGPDIARMLHISLNTLRSHTKNIYSKLEVNNRRAAVRRADELELD